MQDALRIGTAVFNAGDHRVAHEAWEEAWLPLERGTADERLLHGLIQYTVAVHHARHRNWRGAQGLADSAGAYLAAVDADKRGVNVADVREYLRRLAADPEFAERRRPLALRVDGDALAPTDLSFENVASAARLVAADYDAFDESVVDDAVRYAREELDDARPSENDDHASWQPRRRSHGFVTLLFDFAADRDRRSLIYERLRAHVDRQRSTERDVSGLFE